MRHRLKTAVAVLKLQIQRLRADESGNVLIYVTLASAALLGMVGLALDGSRAMITHSELQAAADAAALAAASQLDGASDALVRATNAAQNTPLVSNSQRFAVTTPGYAPVSIIGIRFLSDLPASDSAPISASFVTTDPSKARFAEVTTQQVTHRNTLLIAAGANATHPIQRTAVAGFRQVFCKIPPLMICNPDETATNTTFDGASRIGAEIKAKSQGGSSQWGPGTFGLLQLPDCGNSANCMRDALASIAPASCVDSSIDVRPGEAQGPTSSGLDTRFDIYKGGIAQSPANAPDTNITTDFKACPNDTVQAGTPLPDDNDNPPPKVFGNGEWNCAAYWAANHSQAAPPGCTATASASGPNPLTRYMVYHLEKTAGYGSNYGAPRCVTPGIDERRTVYLVVVNCSANNVSSNSTNVPAIALLKTFMLRPVSEQGSDAEIDMEVIDVVHPGQNNVIVKDDVQLYR